ncbi:MAG TPA: hypothetical protein VGE07_30370, partial [Herpetosiphonaceae bacterium]
MAHIPIRQLTLYKQGIGYFRRAGTMTGTQVALVIPRAGTNDALKSLDVRIRAGGPFLSVDYETPEDSAALLDTLAVKVADRSSFADVLASLRGSHVTLHLDDESAMTGRLIGLESSLEPA